MAYITYTESDLQDYIHSHYEGDADTPASTDDDYVYRRQLLNAYINRWERDNGILWQELWTNTTNNSTGATLTIADGTTSYAVPTAFRFPGGYVKILDASGAVAKTLTVVKPEQWQVYGSTNNIPNDVAYFVGNPSAGYTLHISSGNSTTYDTNTLNYDYYKKATILDSTDDVPEMSDPFYLVHAVVADLFKQDNNVTQQTYHAREAENRIKQMEIVNIQNTNYQGIENEDIMGGVMGL